MKKVLPILLCILTLQLSAQTPFLSGNLVVVRVGDGVFALSNKSAPITIFEMSTAGVIRQSFDLPYTNAMVSGNNNKITTQGSSSNDANLSTSGNGAYFILTGYNSDTGIATISSVAGVKRTICRIGLNGVYDCSTLIDTARAKGNARAATSDNGSKFWQVGSSGGVKYVPYGSTGSGNDTSVVVSTTITNFRTIQTYGGNLIGGTGSLGVRVGRITGFPTSGENTMVQFPGIATTITANSIYMTSLPSGPAGLNTMYVASDASPSGILKYCLNATTNNWDSVGAIASGTTYRGLTGVTSGSTVTLYGIAGNSPLNSMVDATGYNVAPAGVTPQSIATAGTNYAFRGVQINQGIVPIRLLSFNATKKEDGTAKIWWNVSTDDDVLEYVVEKSTNAKDFTFVNKVSAAGKTTYECFDNAVLSTTTYYRVKFVSKNGSYSYTNTVAVTPKKSIKLDIFPNPAENIVILSFPMLKEDAAISLSTIDGKQIVSSKLKAGSNQFNLDISNYPKGIYVLKFVDTDDNILTKQIIKN